MFRTYTLALTCALLAFGQRLDAQERGSPANCHGIVTATLASGRMHGDFTRCRAELPTILSEAIREARDQTDVRFLALLASYSSQTSHPAVLSAAFELTANRVASVPARMAGLLILNALVKPNVSFQLGDFSKLFTEPLDERCGTISFSLEFAGAPLVNEPLPAGNVEQLAVLATRIADDESEPLLMRRYANCLLLVLPEPPVDIQPGQVTITYRCDNDFDIRNDTDEYLTVTWDVEGSDEAGETVLRPRQVELHGTDTAGTLRLYYRGQLIASATNAGTPCP